MEVMERKASDGCCVVNADVAWKMDRILLRYRPIAPKPAASATGTAVEPTPAGGRAKRRGGARRKAVTGGAVGGRRGRKSRKVEAAPAPVVTLSLMPETPERKEGGITAGAPPFFPPELEGKERSGVVVVPRPVRAAGVWVTVESLADAWDVGVCESGGDNEVRRRLEAEDTPAFLSDSADFVTWTNTAYRRMVVGGGESPQSSSSSSSSYNSSSSLVGGLSPPETAVEEEVRVALVTRGLVPGGACRAFTCMARVRYACRRRGMVSLAMPCDVWRMEDGGLAWRLDVKAALGLSIGA